MLIYCFIWWRLSKMDNYEVEFREVKFARTIYQILKSRCQANGNYDPEKIRISNSTITVSSDIFGRLEKLVENHRKLVKKVRKPKD